MNPALPENWHYVYLLTNRESKLYIGCTNNLEKRLAEHNQGKVFTTKKMLPVDLIYYEAYSSQEHAYQREKKLKNYGSGLAKLKARIGRAG